MGIGISIENLDDAELSDGEDQIVYRACAGKLVQTRLDRLRRAAKSQSIAEEGAGKSEVGTRHTNLVGFSAWKAGDTKRVAEAKTLIDLGIHIGFEPVPQA